MTQQHCHMCYKTTGLNGSTLDISTVFYSVEISSQQKTYPIRHGRRKKLTVKHKPRPRQPLDRRLGGALKRPGWF
jgi:hypothetical protein